ncbi:MAG: RNA polymerase sigma factor [Longimicrobiales bacterium]
MDDEGLVRRILDGDRSALDLLVGRYLRRAMAVAWEFAQTREDAEDLVQDAFLRVIEALPGYDLRRPFPPWFFTIVRNVGRNAAARRARIQFTELPEDLEGEAGADGPDDRVDPVDLDRFMSRMPELMNSLAPMQRRCLRLCDLEEFSAKEVGEMLGIAPPTVRVHVHRARAALRAKLTLQTEDGSGP